jgi:hypothetical protein
VHGTAKKAVFGLIGKKAFSLTRLCRTKAGTGAWLRSYHSTVVRVNMFIQNAGVGKTKNVRTAAAVRLPPK